MPMTFGNHMCVHIDSSIRKTNGAMYSGFSRLDTDKCWATYQPVCGDGIVDDEEACDSGSFASACCTSTCQLTTGSECASSNDCCVSCKYAPSIKTCIVNSNGWGGYCGNKDVCTPSFCPTYGLTFCGVDDKNACLQKCFSNGNCTSMQTFTDLTGRPLPTALATGASPIPPLFASRHPITPPHAPTC